MRALTALSALVLVACSGCATAVTGFPTSIAEDRATVAGKVVNDIGVLIEYWAQYGPTQAYGSETPHEFIGTPDYEVQSVFPRIAGLQRSTSYHYRVCARDTAQQGGPGCGEDRTFTTQSAGCGDTLTADLRLTGDLDCPQEAGFSIGADGVDVDLAGHGMFGSIASGGGGPTGIDNSAGYDDLTVRNGTVGGFGFGIVTDGASRNRVLNVFAAAAGNAVTIDGGSFNEIRNSDLSGRSWGIRVTSSDSFLVSGTSASGGFGDGISVSGDLARIVRNELARPGGGSQSVSGIVLTGSGARIADNRVEGSWSLGGINATGANNVVVDNVVTGALFPSMGDPASAGDGIFVLASSGGTVVRRNRADDNEGDGIEVRSAGVKLEGNAAFGNGDWGIDAVTGVIDLGGNIAGGNGNPGQCRNVFCP